MQPPPSEFTQLPLVTIAIPTYNRASWLKKCVESALAQTYPIVDVVVSDNGSTDDTASVLAGFRDQRLRTFRQSTNLGFIANWNACLAQAQGAYIIILPDDDEIDSTFVWKCVELINKNPEIDLIIGLADTNIVESNNIIEEKRSKIIGTGIVDGVKIMREILRDEITPPPMCTIAIRTEILRERGGFSADWLHVTDWAVWVPLLFGGAVGYINERCGTFRTHGSTLSAALDGAVRIPDLQKLTGLIIDNARRSIADDRARQAIESEAKRFLAWNLLVTIAGYRERGATLAQIARMVWPVQAEVTAAILGNVRNVRFVIRPLIITVLPSHLTLAIGRFIGAVRFYTGSRRRKRASIAATTVRPR